MDSLSCTDSEGHRPKIVGAPIRTFRRAPLEGGSSLRKASIYTGQHNTQDMETHVYCTTEIPSHDPSVRAVDNSTCLSPRAYCCRNKLFHLMKPFHENNLLIIMLPVLDEMSGIKLEAFSRVVYRYDLLIML
jgi:hypothetical protein